MKIWCMFSIDNNYDQPDNNLIAWWQKKPGFETVLKAIGGNMSSEAHILAAAGIIEGQERTVLDVRYRVNEVEEGELLG